MLYNFSESIKNILADYSFWIIAKVVLALSDLLLIACNFTFYYLCPTLLAIFLGSVFSKPSNPFYWKKFKKEPVKTIQKLFSHDLAKTGVRVCANLIAALMVTLALLLVLSIMAPPDGMHVRDKLTDQNKALIFGCLSIFFIMIVYIKAGLYSCAGFIKSPGDFKLRMIFW